MQSQDYPSNQIETHNNNPEKEAQTDKTAVLNNSKITSSTKETAEKNAKTIGEEDLRQGRELFTKAELNSSQINIENVLSEIKQQSQKENKVKNQYYGISVKVIAQNKNNDIYITTIKSNESLLKIFDDLNAQVKNVNEDDKNKNKRDAILNISALALGTGGIITTMACNNLNGLIAGILLISCAALVLALTYANRTKEEDKKKQNFKNFDKTLTSIVQSIDEIIGIINKTKQEQKNKLTPITILKNHKEEINEIINSLNNSISSNKKLNITKLLETINKFKVSIKLATQGLSVAISEAEYKESIKKINAAQTQKEAQQIKSQLKAQKTQSQIKTANQISRS